MLEARTEPEAGGGVGLVTDARAHRGHGSRVRLIAPDIRQKSHVVAGLHAPEMALQISRQRIVPTELGGIARIGVESHAVLAKYRLFLRQAVRFLVGFGQRARLDLARLDVRLIEWIDADDLTGDGGGDLPTEEFLADMPDIFDADFRNWMAGLLKCCHSFLL